MVSQNIEDYLENIFLFIKENKRPVKTTELAKLMKVQPAAVTSMAKKLHGDGLIDYQPYIGINLKDSGEKIAKETIRKHRIIEYFLTEILGLDLEFAQEEACKIEHAVSDKTIEKLYEFIDRPEKCPHGYKINLK
ncbi:metal-dependent transcriptional regulator [Methanococcus maripaludis]|uniref:DtxR family Mn-dependent transcriptional regulator n=1 Tax=Methanococcus maripaludis TaxID=39152 RepID=A0A8T4CJS5_METMI|nr:metal-dependent transcriptional regulator [Methanococcus maripaludis]MBM7408617.1 DtxR family Mn-dependent transcriptional regulator [Methanococcus maripaludis]MBP2219864.1 DtxR family Mn-dependent transcriptional regulator [Methanococcus maripaludis]